MENKRKKGSEKEHLAAQFLAQKGYAILALNFHYGRSGEVDIIAKAPDRKTIVFFEVKYRKSRATGFPAEAVNFKKQQTICRVADFYRVRYKILDDVPCRFDVIAILGDEITHIENAFEYIVV